MNKEEVIQLVKQHSEDTVFLSFTKVNHPAYLALEAAGPEIIPFLLERLQDSIGHDTGKAMDVSNNPWLSIHLINVLSNGTCLAKMPSEYAGRLDQVRNFILEWGRDQNLIKALPK